MITRDPVLIAEESPGTTIYQPYRFETRFQDFNTKMLIVSKQNSYVIVLGLSVDIAGKGRALQRTQSLGAVQHVLRARAVVGGVLPEPETAVLGC
jgi:hypothetical protein